MLNTTRRGGVTGFFLGLLFGIIVALGAIAGAGFYAYKNVKVGKIAGENVSADLGALTIEKFIKEMSATFKDKDNLTVARLEEMFPPVAKILPDEGVAFGSFGKLDVAKLKDIPLASISANFADALVITATLSTLETDLGAKLPNMPFIQGGAEGLEVWTYVAATEEKEGAHVLKAHYAGEKELYAAAPEGSDPAWLPATEEKTGEDGATYWAVKAEYEGQPLWFKSNGLLNVNVIDALSALSETLDFNKLTFRELEHKFGINLKQQKEGEEPGYHPVIEKLLDRPVNNIGSDMDGIINDLYISEVVTIQPDDKYLNAISRKRGSDGNLLGVYTDPESGETAEVPVDAEGVPLNGEYGDQPLPVAQVKISEIDGQIGNLRLDDFVDNPGGNKILDALGGTPVNGLSARIDTLTLAEVMDVSDPTLCALAYRKDETCFYLAVNGAGESLSSVDPEKYEVRADGKFYPRGSGESGAAIENCFAVPTRIQGSTGDDGISAQVGRLLLAECVTVDGGSPAVLKELQFKPVKNLGAELSALPMDKVVGEDTVKGYIRANIPGTNGGAILPTFAGKQLYRKTGDSVYEEVSGTPTDLDTTVYYVSDYTSVWHFVFNRKDAETGEPIVVTLDNVGESVGSISDALFAATIGELYDRQILKISSYPNDSVRAATLKQVIDNFVALGGNFGTVTG